MEIQTVRVPLINIASLAVDLLSQIPEAHQPPSIQAAIAHLHAFLSNPTSDPLSSSPTSQPTPQLIPTRSSSKKVADPSKPQQQQQQPSTSKSTATDGGGGTSSRAVTPGGSHLSKSTVQTALVKRRTTKKKQQQQQKHQQDGIESTEDTGMISKDGKILPRVLFSSHDLDGSGEISVEEFRGLIYSLGYYLSEEELKVAISSLDKDGNGEISYDEFLEWWEADERFQRLKLDDEGVAAVQRATEFFQFYDTEDKGTVTAEQFSTMFEYMRQWPGYFQEGVTLDQAYQEIKSAAVNSSGATGEDVSFNDYLRYAEKYMNSKS